MILNKIVLEVYKVKPYNPEKLPLDKIDYNIFIEELSEANRNLARGGDLIRLSCSHPIVMMMQPSKNRF